MTEHPPRTTVAPEEPPYDVKEVEEKVLKPFEAFCAAKNAMDAMTYFRGIDTEKLLGAFDAIDARALIRDRVFRALGSETPTGVDVGFGLMPGLAARIVERDFRAGKYRELRDYASRFLTPEVLSNVTLGVRKELLLELGKHSAVTENMFKGTPDAFLAFMDGYVEVGGTFREEEASAWAAHQSTDALTLALVEQTQDTDSALFSKRVGEELDVRFMQEFGVESGAMLSAWKRVGGPKKRTPERIQAHLTSMRELEHHTKGSVKRLVETYGIREFSRYSTEMLTAQLAEEGETKPYGVMIFPRADYNGAFDYRTHRAPLDQLQRDMRGRLGIKIVEVESVSEATRQLVGLDTRYGKEEKMSFVIIAGHGSESSIQFGDTGTSGDKLSQKRIQTPSFRKARQLLKPKAPLLLISCSTGADQGIADELSRALDASVVAPKIPANVASITTNFGSEGLPVFEVKFFAPDEDVAHFEAGRS